ncbi:MAG: KdsC family phosphatase [Lachnospiraceae bacterium]
MKDQKVKLLVMDVDGTLTDGRIYIGVQGEVMKSFDVRDGYAIAQILPKEEIIPVIITGRSSDIVMERARELKITELYQGISDKLSQLKIVAEKYEISPKEIAYIGDDLNDLECIKYCGVTGCPNDATSEAKAEVSYVCSNDGGRGAVREFIEWFLK